MHLGRVVGLLALVMLTSGAGMGCKLKTKRTKTIDPSPLDSDIQPLDAVNQNDIQRFPDETRLFGEIDLVRQLGSVKTAPRENAPLVSLVTSDTVVRKFAIKDGFTLVTFDERGARKGGWVRQSAFEKSTVVVAPATTVTPAPAVALSPSSRQSAWLGSITGRDNDAANYRRAKISGSPGSFAITIDNQFGFTCGLVFDSNGRPSRLTSCRSSQNWTASPSSIGLFCSEGGGQEVCTSSSYTLSSGTFSNSAKFQIIRRL